MVVNYAAVTRASVQRHLDRDISEKGTELPGYGATLAITHLLIHARHVVLKIGLRAHEKITFYRDLRLYTNFIVF